MKFVASCSFGKDSLATILLALEHSEPLDEAVYCEVMFDNGISGEVPEHRDFIYGRAIPFLKKNGIRIEILRADVTYIQSFYRVLKKGKNTGKINSWPLCGKCCIQRECKLAPNKATERFNRDERFDEIDALFKFEDAQLSLFACGDGDAAA